MITYAKKERARYWPITPELLAQYRDGSHTKNESGSLEWHQNGKLHRDGDLPAWIGADGSLEWYQNGEEHRDGDRPAFISADGYLHWMQNDQIHRFVGPAVIFVDDTLVWVRYDENITQEVRKWLAGEEWRGTPEQIVEFQLRFL